MWAKRPDWLGTSRPKKQGDKFPEFFFFFCFIPPKLEAEEASHPEMSTSTNKKKPQQKLALST